jgi:hypothetical protein
VYHQKVPYSNKSEEATSLTHCASSGSTLFKSVTRLIYSYHQKCLVQTSHKYSIIRKYLVQISQKFNALSIIRKCPIQISHKFYLLLSSDVPCWNQSQVCTQSLGSTLFKTQPGHLSEVCHGLSQSPQEHATIIPLIRPEPHPFILVNCPYIRWHSLIYWHCDLIMHQIKLLSTPAALCHQINILIKCATEINIHMSVMEYHCTNTTIHYFPYVDQCQTQ